MEFLQYILDNYSGDLFTIALTYVGVASIVLIFFPLKKIIGFLKEAASIIISLFKR